ncbi:MAG: type II CAAX endopeptidase family protein [Candidatus Micrarchaeaceae archaeon]
MAVPKRRKPQRNRPGAARLVAYAALYLLIAAFAATIALFDYGYIQMETANYLLTAILSLLFLSVPIAYLLHREPLPMVLDEIGLSKGHISAKFIGIGILLFVAVFVFELLLSAFVTATGISINTNVGALLFGAPGWFIFFSFIIAPIDEEVLFRGFLVPRIGIFWSALIFGILHAGYMSSFGIDIVAAFIFGILAGYVFKKTKSLYPSIIAHIFVNMLAVMAYVV